MDAYNKAKAERAERLRGIADALANMLGKRWDVEPRSPMSISVRCADGASVWLHVFGSEDRVNVSGSWPTNERGQQTSARDWFNPYGDGPKPPKKITVGLNRDPEKAANDIMGRFYSEYIVCWDEARKLANERISHRNAAVKLRDELIELFPGASRVSHSDDLRIWLPDGGEVRVNSANSVEVKLRMTDAEKVKQLAELLK